MFLERTLVLIPALNEAASISGTIEQWHRLGTKRVRVVDNGSTDSTSTMARTAGAEVVHEPKRGYGAAVWQGLQDWPSDCEWVLFSSADGSDRLAAQELVAWKQAVTEGADLVMGDRTALARSRAQLKPTQRFGNWLCVLVIAWGWGRRFCEMGSLRLIRRDALERMQLQDRGFGWNLEMQVRAIELGLKVIELPVEYHPRMAGESKISGSLSGTFRAGKGILRMLLQLYRLKHVRQRPAATTGTVAA